MVIEAVTGQDYRDVIRKKVLAPLGLANEIFVGVPASEQERCADTREASTWKACRLIEEAGAKGATIAASHS
jgi:CubicO group peptidase (beta-lactamase class C family)